eukprot:g21114.t1
MEYPEAMVRKRPPHRAAGILGRIPLLKKTASLGRDHYSWVRPPPGPLEYLETKDEEDLHTENETSTPGDDHAGLRPPLLLLQ